MAQMNRTTVFEVSEKAKTVDKILLENVGSK
jgi:hypothetical protein